MKLLKDFGIRALIITIILINFFSLSWYIALEVPTLLDKVLTILGNMISLCLGFYFGFKTGEKKESS